MKKETIETRTDSFVDFSGKERKFVIAAISEVLPEEDEDGYTEDHFVYECSMSNGCNPVDQVTKRLSIGFAITNGDDVFNEELGKTIAIGKARKKPVATMYVDRPGLINTLVVDAVLNQEIAYFKENPGYAIAGYKAAERRYQESQKQ